jgi:DNA-binding response OmpR family regulator
MPHPGRDELLACAGALALALEELGEDPVEASASIRRVAAGVTRLADESGDEELAAAARLLLEADDACNRKDVRSLVVALDARVTGKDAAEGVILIIDDDRVGSRMLQAKLASTNRDILVAESVAEAERMLAGEDVALILLDLFLPDADGRNLLVDLRSRPGTEEIPVIVLSGNTSPLAKSECIALGANAYVEKPFDPDSLIATVTAYLLHNPGRAGETPSNPADASAKETSPASRRVLLAEDDRVTAALILHRLERDGYEVVHCSDGFSAFEEAQRGDYGLIILDVKMPGMDGFEVLGRLRELDGGRGAPIVMLTAMGREEDVVKAFELGANDYVLKPFSPHELTARVRRLVASD